MDGSLHIADLGGGPLSYGGPGSGADVELPTLEGLGPAGSVLSWVPAAIEAGLGARSRVREHITDLVMSLPARARERIERQMRALPTVGACADIDDTATAMEVAVVLADEPEVRRRLKLAQGYLRALSEPCLGFEDAAMRCVRLVGQMLQHDNIGVDALGNLGGLVAVVSYAVQGDACDGLINTEVTSARDVASVLRSDIEAQLSDEGLERLGLLLGRLELLPERRWSSPTPPPEEAAQR